MCIFLCTRSHRDYPLILISNRDEYFERPTQAASFVDDRTLCPVDLARPEHGTWIGVTKDGRLSVLVNYREPLQDLMTKSSRGGIPVSFLHSELPPMKWAERARKEMNNFEDVGGFSFFFGQLRPRNNELSPMYIFSNRCDEVMSVFNTTGAPPDVETKSFRCDERQYSDTLGLSNSPFTEPWPKVRNGKRYLGELANEAMDCNWSQERLVSELFKLLSKVTPPSNEYWKDMGFNEAFEQMPNTIFVPPVEKPLSEYMTALTGIPSLEGHYYGTRTQTVVLVDTSGHLTYIERNLHTGSNLSETPTTQSFQFDIEGWNTNNDLRI